MPDHPHFPHLFQPYILKGLALRNRVAISGLFAGWWVDKGLPSEEFAAYIEERAKGGVGLFVIGATSPERGSGWMESISDDIIPRYKMLAQAGHRHGTAVFAQLCHPGYRPLPGAGITGDIPSANSTQPTHRHPDRTLPSIEKLQELIEAFGQGARRAAEGGTDGVELHSHESFLHAQMLNPMWNTRTDAYGGSLKNRMRFLVETLQAMRRGAGDTLPLGVRLKADDMEQRGMGVAEYIEVIQHLEGMGLADYVILTGGDGRYHHGPTPRPEGEWLPLVKQVRDATKLTLLHAGRITTPEMAERAVAEGTIDIVCMTKTHICDPHFTRKAYENRLEDIRYCTRCLQSCHGQIERMTCVYNPLTSREKIWSTLTLAPTRKKIVVIGAGPAGMEAALNAAQRGHQVTVLERSPQIGGQVLLGAASPSRRPWGRIAEFYTRQAAKGIFETRLGEEATLESVLALQPDAVIVATGSRPNRLEIAGGEPALTVHEVLQGSADTFKRMVLFDREGFSRPLVAGDYLTSRGVHLEIVTSLLRFIPSLETMVVDEFVSRFREKGTRFHVGFEIGAWDSPGVLRLRDVQTAEERVLEGIEAVIATIGSTAVNGLAQCLRGHVAELYVIGDANTPQTVEHATYQGARLGREI